MKKGVVLVAVAIGFTAHLSELHAASNKDRIGVTNRKSEEQPPQASETKQFCTRASARANMPGGNWEKDGYEDSSKTEVCSSTPATRSSEEARAESRKVERSPDN